MKMCSRFQFPRCAAIGRGHHIAGRRRHRRWSSRYGNDGAAVAGDSKKVVVFLYRRRDARRWNVRPGAKPACRRGDDISRTADRKERATRVSNSEEVIASRWRYLPFPVARRKRRRTTQYRSQG